MKPRSLTLALLLPLLLLLSPFLVSAHDPSAPSPSPSPSPAPSPSLRRTAPKQVDSTSIQLPPPPPPPPAARHPPLPRTSHGQLEQPPGVVPARRIDPRQLNLGEKVGLAFLVAAVVLQVALGGFLVFKRSKLRNMVREDRQMAAPTSAHSS